MERITWIIIGYVSIATLSHTFIILIRIAA